MDEAIDFRRSAALPGVEVLNARNTEREWRWFNTAYSIAVPTTWIGGVHYRGRYMGTTPGMVFCSAPGEIHVTQSGQRGTFHVLLFETEVFQSMAREAGATAEVTWGQIVGEPPAALRRLALALVNGIGETDDFAQQSLFTELFSGLAA
ncbi:MAG: AraC family ligand binding domain-containing protein, partial [Myxococcota bacterium]